MDSILIELLLNGIFVGGVFALFSVGLTLIFGVMKIVNFAHGEFIMLGMYMAFWVFSILGVSPYIGIVIIAPAFFLLGLIIQKLVIQPILRSFGVAQLFATVGLGIVMQNSALILWTADPRSIQGVFGEPAYFLVGNVRIFYTELTAFLIAMMMTFLLIVILKRTKFGRAMRATSQDLQAAQLMGINVKRIYLFAFAISSACVGISGAVIVPIYPVVPTVGFHFALIAFVVVILGGIGNLHGTFLAGLTIGVIDSLAGYYLDTAFKESTYFIILLIILWFRPSGLFARKQSL